ncbi:MAG: bifunctional UDP-N-acetylglucosamine diphosphorylase/glucosamine-1-phosphate N-acetyltransferase GlmU [Deltaproteobacteria bacterium]|nr:bifunctional UDP-N-acetylglucosamine diphosphorylase/glucosamine-1-phosphate N-acetyltransferase GlmU [Deltaproteobacteria bacterium]
MNDLGAIVLAAGKGTRMRSPRSKLLHPLLGEYLVYYPLRALYDAGVRRLVIVVGHGADEVRAAIAGMAFLSDAKIDFVVQEPQRGTGHAVQVALDGISALEGVKAPPREWVIACGDSPHLDDKAIARLIEARRGAKVVVLAARVADPTGYGRMIEESGRLERIVEHKDANERERAVNVVNAGAYAVEHAFLSAAVKALQPKNAQNELYLTDIVPAAPAAERKLCVADAPECVLGVNSQHELMRSTALVQAAIVRRWHEGGVTIEAEDVTIGPRVTIDPGAFIQRGVTLLGATHVSAAAVIEHHAHLDNVRVAEGARVRAFTYAEDSEIGPRAQVGPVSRLRSGSVLEEGAEVGNFCEVKKTRVKAKAKAHHVSYLGDAEIGSGTNIGAGTIICNYNGFTKPFSRIGADVFIGSNSTLVAPVNIEDRAYVAAGSVITEPVPSDALALGRARQTNKDGYAKELKERLKKDKK